MNNRGVMRPYLHSFSVSLQKNLQIIDEDI